MQTTKATKTLRRNDLLDDYCGKTIAGQSVAAAHRIRPKSASFYMPPGGYEYGELEAEPEPVQFVRERRGRPSSATVVLQRDATAAVSHAGYSRRRPTSAMALTSDSMTRERPPSSTQLSVASGDNYGSRSRAEQGSRSIVSLQNRHSDASRKSSRTEPISAVASAQ